MQKLLIKGWRVENADDHDMGHLVMSLSKLRILRKLSLRRTLTSLSALKMFTEKFPDLQKLDIYLNSSTIPPFNATSESLGHKLKILTVWSVCSLIVYSNNAGK